MMSAKHFWESFRENASEWAAQLRSENNQLAFAGIEELLAEHDLEYCFDLTYDDMDCLFIMSPEGNFETAERIDQTISFAPPISEWRIFGRRQKKELDAVQAIILELYWIDPLKAKFRIVNENGRECVEMYVSQCANLTSEEGKALVETFLWHSIGENVVMERRLNSRLSFGFPIQQYCTAMQVIQYFEN